MKTRLGLTATRLAAALILAGSGATVVGQDMPRFNDLLILSNRESQVTLAVVTGQYCRILTSSNLLEWNSLSTGISTGLVVSTDSSAPFVERRFYRACQFADTNITTGDHLATTNGDVVIHPIYHASFALDCSNVMVYVDPANNRFDGLVPANLMLFTHGHSDHFLAGNITPLMASNAVIVAPPIVYQGLSAGLQSVTTVLRNGFSATRLGIGIEAVPMYNTNSANHPMGIGNGYVLTMGGKRVYVSGDTDNIPEIRALTNIDVAIVGMRPPYSMSSADAADLVRTFRPKVVYPCHYGTNDVNAFKQMVGTDLPIEVRLRKWY